MSAQPDEPIRGLISDDHKVVRQGFAGFLATEPDIEVVGSPRA
jgi:DNA-binding NarL/FixJ family response regulator